MLVYTRKDSSLRFIPAITSIIIFCLASLVTIGWYTHSITLVQLSTSAPMLGNTAISFLFCSIALITLTFTPNHRYLKIGLVSSIVVLLIGLTTISQHIFNIDLGIDQLFIKPFTNDQIIYAGRMPLVTSLCFVFLAISILSLNRLTKYGQDYLYIFIAEILTISSLIISLVSFFEHLIGVNTYGGLAYTKMAKHTSLCFIFLSIGIFAIVFDIYKENKRDIKTSYKKPLLIGIILSLICVFFWQALVNKEKLDFQDKIKAQGENTKLLIASQLNNRVEGLVRMAKRRETRLDIPKEEWEADATSYVNDYNGFQAIEWVDSSYIVRWVIPKEGNQTVQGFNLLTENTRKQALYQAKEKHKAVFTKSFDLVQGGKGFLVCVPIYAKEQFSGFILGVFRFEQLFNVLLNTDSLKGFIISIYDNNQLVYKAKTLNQPYEESLKYKTTLSQNGLNWQLEFYPTSNYIYKNTSSLPTIALIVGLILSGLFSYTSYLVETGKYSTQQILKANQHLVNEISARKLLEENKNRLLSILESTTDFIGIANPITGQGVYLNHAARVFHGISDTEDCSKIFIDDIHPKEITKIIFEEAIPALKEKGYWSGETLLKSINNKDKQIKVSEVLIAHKSASGEVEYISTIMRDITERIRVEEEMKAAKETAEAATQAKAEFLANMSHEIRTPMNAVIGLTELLLGTKLDNQQKDFIETIRSSGNSLLTIINDILDFSKIESGKLSLELEPFDLRNCIEQSLDILATKASEKGLELAYLISENTPSTIIGDITRLHQILVNLLSNAIKFTPKGEVLISVKVKEIKDNTYTLHFSVKDTGIGIAKDRQHLLFQSFSQVDSSITRKYGGTGLGLTISKYLSELMGGTMWVESDSGQGSNFQFTILAKSAPSEKQIYLQALQPQLAGKKILIVDNNSTNKEILVKQTQSWGMIPTSLESGLEALEQLQKGLQTDIAILNINMPEMDGVTLALEIRKIPNLKTLPLVMLSSQGYKLDNLEKELNFTANLTKPIKQFQLYDLLIEIFGTQEDKAIKIRPRKELEVEQNLSSIPSLVILLAEDNLINQKVAIQILKRLGYQADIASNGLEVLKKLENKKYDLILMDVQMPEMDGLTATRQIFQLYTKENRPKIIAMTAGATVTERQQCLDVGMDDFFTKPIDIYKLQQILSEYQNTINFEKTQKYLLKQQPETAIEKSLESALKDKLVELDLSEPILNALQLETLISLQDEDDPDLVTTLIDMFIIDSKDKLDKLSNAINQIDLKTVKAIAHSLASPSSHLGAYRLVNLCNQIEDLAIKKQENEIKSLFTMLLVEFEKVCSELKIEQEKRFLRRL